MLRVERPANTVDEAAGTLLGAWALLVAGALLAGADVLVRGVATPHATSPMAHTRVEIAVLADIGGRRG
jgi:hypothetical protein